MLLFGTTTFMFTLGIIALVLKAVLDFELFCASESSSYSDAAEGLYPENTYYYVWAAMTCLMVRMHDAFMPSA